MAYLDPFNDDPVYSAIRASAAQRRAQRRAEQAQALSASQQIAGVGSGEGGSGESPGADTGIAISGPVTSVTPANAPTPTPEYGMTMGYGTANRVGEFIGTNINPIAASIAYETVEPLKGAAIGTAIDTVLGDAPGYLTQETREGVRSQVGGFDPTKSYGQFPDGRIAEVTAEDIATGGFKQLTAAEATRLNPTGYIGADPRTPLGAIGKGLQTLATSMVPFSGMMFGKTVPSPIGTPMAMGSGPFGPMVHDRMYETHGNMLNGVPGNYGMRIGDRYVTYNANPQYIGGKLGETLGIKSAMTAGMNMSTEQFQKLYGARAGFDYRTVDWENSKPGELKGEKLEGFVSGRGGFTKDGQFLDSQGRLTSNMTGGQLSSYSESAVRSGTASAAAAAEALDRKAEMAANDLFFGTARQKTYAEAAAKVRSEAARAYEQASAAYPGRQNIGVAEQLGLGAVADSLTQGITRGIDVDAATDIGLGLTDTGYVYTPPGYTSVGADAGVTSNMRYDPTTGNYYNFNLDQPSKAVPGEVYFDDGGSSASSGGGWSGDDQSGSDWGGNESGESAGAEASGSPGTDSATADADSMDSGWRSGGFVTKKAVGGPVEQAGVGPVGFVNGKAPEQVSEQKSIADDVEGKVPEGTFVINAAAVERAGSSDIRKMLTKAIAEAEAQGIDLSGQGVTMDSEDAVSVAVSEGEVLVPPVLARIIGYDRLEKINKRGEAEVQRRAQEAEQQNQQPQMPMKAREGGFVQKKSEGGKVDPRRVLPVSDFKSYNTGDSGRDFLNWVENTGATILGKREEMQKAFSYARNYARNNRTEDQYEDTMRHVLLGGLYAGGPDDNVLEKIGSKIASGFADYKEKGAVAAENIEPVDRFESAIDLNNNQYGRALRKAAGDEEAFVGAVEKLMDRLRSGQEAPRLTNEDGKEITIVTSTADGRAGFLRREN